ncbi:MAG: hypothetical protein WD426_12240 [Anditalea sp.]
MKKFLIFGVVCTMILSELTAQSAYAPIDRDYYHLLDRYGIVNGGMDEKFHTGFKPFRRDDIAAFVNTLGQDQYLWNKVNRFNISYLRNDNWEFSQHTIPVSRNPWKGLYKKPSDFFHYRDSIFDIHINPVLYFQGGIESGKQHFQFRNTRGIEMRGSIDRKVGFYTFLTTTESTLPSWVHNYARNNGAVPGEGFWKPYRDTGFSYFSATGYITFQVSKHIVAQMGQDRNFVGEGYRSMILSDFSSPYMFFKLNTRIWKFNLTNLWGQMNADVLYNRGRPTDGRYPQKWFSHHRLSINLGRKLNIGLFESVMANQFDWNYLNPIIFYRWVEHQLGTPDKVMLGTDFKWNFYPSMQLYGQFSLDEFVFKEFFGTDGKNSSRNKHGIQAGYKYIDFFKISNLDLQLEYNQARPFTYQEKFDYQSFSNYRTPLTHPRGANFREAVAILRYQPLPRLSLNATGIYHYFGTDPDEASNFGGDILKNRTSQSTGLLGNKIGQGVENKVLLGTLNATYMLRHNLFVDASHTYRNHTLHTEAPEGNHLTQLSVRMNISRQEFNY